MDESERIRRIPRPPHSHSRKSWLPAWTSSPASLSSSTQQEHQRSEHGQPSQEQSQPNHEQAHSSQPTAESQQIQLPEQSSSFGFFKLSVPWLSNQQQSTPQNNQQPQQTSQQPTQNNIPVPIPRNNPSQAIRPPSWRSSFFWSPFSQSSSDDSSDDESPIDPQKKTYKLSIRPKTWFKTQFTNPILHLASVAIKFQDDDTIQSPNQQNPPETSHEQLIHNHPQQQSGSVPPDSNQQPPEVPIGVSTDPITIHSYQSSQHQSSSNQNNNHAHQLDHDSNDDSNSESSTTDHWSLSRKKHFKRSQDDHSSIHRVYLQAVNPSSQSIIHFHPRRINTTTSKSSKNTSKPATYNSLPRNAFRSSSSTSPLSSVASIVQSSRSSDSDSGEEGAEIKSVSIKSHRRRKSAQPDPPPDTQQSSQLQKSPLNVNVVPPSPDLDFAPAPSTNENDPNLNDHSSTNTPIDMPTNNTDTDTLTIPQKIQLAFDLPYPTPLIAETPCTLIHTIMISGTLYLTPTHTLFYACLPPSTTPNHTPTKSGFLFYRSRSHQFYTKYWFTLTPHGLYRYTSPTDIYYPITTINLLHVTHIRVTSSTTFTITTQSKHYYFKTDTPILMDEWVSVLRQAVYRYLMPGTDIRVVIPVSSIRDTDIMHVVGASGSVPPTLRIRVTDTQKQSEPGPSASGSGETFGDVSSTDDGEYYFTWFGDQHQRRNHADSTDSNDTVINTVYTIIMNTIRDYRVRQHKDDHESHESLNRTSSSTDRSGENVNLVLPKASGNLIVPASVTKASSCPALLPTLPTTTTTTAPTPSGRFSNIRTSINIDQARKTTPDTDTNAQSDTPSPIQPMTPTHQHKHTDTLYKHFPIPSTDPIHYSHTCYLDKLIPRHGTIYVTSSYLCFYSKVVGMRTRVMVPMHDVGVVDRGRRYKSLYYGLVVTTRTQEEIKFDFHSSSSRNKCFDALYDQLRTLDPSTTLVSPDLIVSSYEDTSYTPELNASSPTPTAAIIPDTVSSIATSPIPPPPSSAPVSVPTKLDLHLDDLPYTITPMINTLHPTKPSRPLHITCLTIGTRGDVQPYIALCQGFMKDGHRCRISTHIEYASWIEGFGIEFREVKGDPSDLMQLCVDHGMFTVSFLREAVTKFRGWVDELLVSCYDAVQGTDVIIESPTAMGGIHCAEKLGVPYFAAFPMPWTRTRVYPHPFAVPDVHLGGSYNIMSHVMIEQIFQKGISPQVNRWRRNVLNMPPMNLSLLSDLRIPFLYSFSPAVVPPPVDWPDWIHTCGYWFLDNPEHQWTPPESLIAFLTKPGEPKPVYIGFGSIIVPDPDALTRTVIGAVKKAGVRAILSKGWSARIPKTSSGANQESIDASQPPAASQPIEYPDCIYPIDKVPHDWLFPLTAGVVHHGGAGTTAAGIRAGVPTLIRPFFGDQFFWADRVQDLGIGLCLRKLTVSRFASALVTLTTDTKIRDRAAVIGRQVRSENGVANAVQYVYRDMEFAKQRIRELAERNEKPATTYLSL